MRGLRYGLGITRAVASTVSYSAEVTAWAAAVVSAGGSSNATHRAALDAFVGTGKSDGWFTKLKRCNMFCGDQLAAALVPLVVGGGNATDTNHSFVAGDYTKTGGLVGDTSTKYLQTGWIPSTELSANTDGHMGAVALAVSSNALTRYLLGSQDTNVYEISWQTSGTLQTSHLGTGSSGYVAASPVPGHIVRSNTAVNTGGLYVDAVFKTGITTAGGLSGREIWINVLNNAGSTFRFGGVTFGGYHLGTGLSATDVTNLYNAINTFCTALGRTLP